ncbi:MAG TPA: class II aldolase/adducin family protein [Burkholderiaceae bacterium]|jgi:ribulose-5-phosphate 4-epimerase/fuculose-1-phosphate aldolase|nr:class II aldolase/adducin family protein [Burkholderiaceae bacterium]
MHKFTEEEWALRVDLAACYRLMDMFGMLDMIYNHISARVPGEDAFLINPFGYHYSEITASSLIKVDIEGNVLYNPHESYSVNKAGFVIHSAIHKARHDAECIIHTHTLDGMAVSALKCGLLPLTQTSMRFVNVAYHDYQGVVVDEEEQESLVRDLGDSDVMILRNHGLLVTGRTIPEAFNNIYRLERSCAVQLRVMSTGAEINFPDQSVIQKTGQQLKLQPSADSPGKQKPYGILEWPALKRLLDRKCPDYKD